MGHYSGWRALWFLAIFFAFFVLLPSREKKKEVDYGSNLLQVHSTTLYETIKSMTMSLNI